MPDILSVRMQDIMYSREPELRKDEIIKQHETKVSSDSGRCLFVVTVQPCRDECTSCSWKLAY